MEIHPSVQQGLQHHQAGRLAEAEAAYRGALSENPRDAAALHLLGRLAAQVGRLDDAATLLRKALAAQPNEAVHYLVLGDILRTAKKTDEAIALLTRAAELAPTRPDVRNSLAISLRQANRLNDAVANFQMAIKLHPNYGEAYSNLGNAFRAAGRTADSLEAHGHAARLLPESAEVHNNFGIAFNESRRIDDAIKEFTRALDLAPNFVEAMTNLGGCLVAKGRTDEAVHLFEKAAELRPNTPEILNNLGNIMKEKGRLDDSVAAYRRALQLRPDMVEALSNLAINLSAQGRVDEAIGLFRRAMAGNQERWSYFSNLLYTLHFHPDSTPQSLLAEHHQWAQHFADPLTHAAKPAHTDPDPERRLKIGYVSADFKDHPVGRFLVPLIEAHNHDKFEIIAYSSVLSSDGTTARLRKTVDTWVDAGTLSDAALAERIRTDGIDILVDLTLHMAHSRLLVFAQKPAPVQITWLGYVSTTGTTAIDYRISDPWLDPQGDGDANYVEKTVRLPTSYWCYEPPPLATDVGPLPMTTTGHVTFGCLNNFAKVSAAALSLWAKILAAVPNSRIIIHSMAGSHQADVRYALGVDASRVEFIGFLPTRDYMDVHNRIDIALDPFPYAGGTTTCDALWMGVPVITLAGKTAVGRGGVSILNNVGLPEFIAQSQEEYFNLATSLAWDANRLAALRTSLRARVKASPLMDKARFAGEMESAYRQMWRSWCSAASTR